MPGRDTKRQGTYNTHGYASGRGGGAPRNHVIPSEAPFTAYIGNAPESMVQGDFETHLFVGLKIKQVRLVRDRQTDRFRGFAYVDFDDADSLRRAIELDGTFINDRPIRIDVAVRPLGAAKPEGFRNKPGFESHDGRRHPSGNSNNTGRQGGYNHHQQDTYQHVADGYQDDHNSARNRRPSGGGRMTERRNSQTQQQQHKIPPHQVSNDDVFIAPDTPTSNDEGAEQDGSTVTRQQSRNWADCPIDESVTEPSTPPSANNTLAGDDFQVVRSKNMKPRANQNSAARPMSGTQSLRGRNNGNYQRGGPGQVSGGRGYYDQFPPQYSNQSQQFYQHQQGPPPPIHAGLSYHMNPNNNNNPQHRQPPPRQRVNSNRSNNSRTYPDNDGGFKKEPSEHSADLDNASAPAENRPRLQLLPRSQKLSPSTDEKPTAEPASRNASIFGCGKPRDERDPKLLEFNKHIEEVVEKEQVAPRTKSTASDDSAEGVTKPVRILTASTGS